MDVTPIKTESDFWAVLGEIERLWDVEPDTPDGDRLDILMTLVEAYERRHHPMPSADPIAAIEFMMEQRRIARADLEPIIGSSGRVSEVLNRRRALSVSMIRWLSEALRIPAEILIRRPLRGVFAFVFEHHPNRALADLRGVLGGCRFRHDYSTLSEDGASDKPGAVHFQIAQQTAFQRRSAITQRKAWRLPIR